MSSADIDEGKRNIILIVGGEEGFSDEIVSYATSMADRMDCDIIALNIIPMGRRLSLFLDAGIKEKLQAKVKEKADSFRKVVDVTKISFTHIVKLGDIDKSIREIHQETARISFVIEEPQSAPNKEPIKGNFPVYTLDNDK